MPRNLDKYVTETLRELQSEGSEAFAAKSRSSRYQTTTTEEIMPDTSIFLDKLVTSMHRPRMKGSTGFVSRPISTFLQPPTVTLHEADTLIFLVDR